MAQGALRTWTLPLKHQEALPPTPGDPELWHKEHSSLSAVSQETVWSLCRETWVQWKGDPAMSLIGLARGQL